MSHHHSPSIIYLDHSATTEAYPEVILHMGQIMCDNYGNPSSTHNSGRQAKIIVEESRRKIAAIIGATPSEIFFTSGGTESDNTAIKSAVRAGVNYIITSPLEHHAVTASVQDILSQNEVKTPEHQVQMDYLRILPNGDIDMEHLDALLSQHKGRKTLVSLMHANNEIGNIYDIRAIGALCHEHGAWYHCDAVQSMGHCTFDLKEMPVDMLSVSAHKFHGPKGIGLLYVKSGIILPSLLHGGQQERGMRSGTENVPAIAGMALAMQMNHDNHQRDREHILSLKKHLMERLSEIPGVRFNGHSADMEHSLPSILSVTLPVKKDTGMTLFALDMVGVCVSAGSACMAGAWQASEVIETIYSHQDPMAGHPTLRISIGRSNVIQEIDIAVNAIKDIISSSK